MLIPRWVILIISCLFFAIGQSKNSQYTIPFQIKKGLMIVQASTKEGKIMPYIIDTGSEGLILNQTNAYKGKSEKTFKTFNGEIQTFQSSKISLLLSNGTPLPLSKVYISDLTNVSNYLNEKIGGILGLSVFQDMNVMFDLENQLILAGSGLQPSSLNGTIQLHCTRVQNLPIISISMNQITHHFCLDTGSSVHMISQNFNNNSKVNLTQCFEETILNDASENQKTAVSVHTELFGNIMTQHPKFIIQDFEEINQQLEIELDGIIAGHLLNIRYIFLDFEKELCFIGFKFPSISDATF